METVDYQSGSWPLVLGTQFGLGSPVIWWGGSMRKTDGQLIRRIDLGN